MHAALQAMEELVWGLKENGPGLKPIHCKQFRAEAKVQPPTEGHKKAFFRSVFSH
jgi:hypothetical protein